MKKTLAIVLALVMLLTASVTLISCSNKNPNNVVGVYEMTDISGTLTNNGQVTQLSKDLYEYYTITLEKGGKATIASAAKGSSSEIKQEATWEYEKGELRITSAPQGINVTEIMELKDGVITYETTQQLSATQKISMKIILEKQ